MTSLDVEYDEVYESVVCDWTSTVFDVQRADSDADEDAEAVEGGPYLPVASDASVLPFLNKNQTKRQILFKHFQIIFKSFIFLTFQFLI